MRQFIAFVLLGSSLVACMRNKDDDMIESAESALDSSESVEAEGNVMMSAIDGAELAGLTAATPDQVAMRIAANVALRWQPTGCATATQQGPVITITYSDCTGPRGLLHVNGQIVLTVSVALDGTISVHGESNNLMANEVMLTVNADATYSTSGSTHTLDVDTTGSAVGPRGNELDHVGDYTITWDTSTQCRTLAGDWSTEATRIDGTTAQRSRVANLMRCAGGCPVGSVARTFRTGATLTVTFDGTATAQWSTSTGRTGTVNLLCGR